MSLLRRHSGHRCLYRRGDALNVRDELGVQGHVQAVRSRRSSGVVDCLDHALLARGGDVLLCEVSAINRLIVAEEVGPVERRYSFPVGILLGR